MTEKPEAFSVAVKIEKKCEDLNTLCGKLPEFSKHKAESLAEYEKSLAIVIIKLKNGVEFTLENDTIKNPPISIIDKIAKGICWRESLYKEECEAKYRAILVHIEAVKAEINALQSINRYLSET